MKAIIAMLVSLATLCLAGAIVCAAVGHELFERQSVVFSGARQPDAGAAAEANRLGQIGQALVVSTGPLAAAAVLAVAAILVLLAFRWELRRATRIA